jgi:SlyX protein
MFTSSTGKCPTGPQRGAVLASSAVESRLVDLETRYTHLERQVADLSEVVFEQQKIIEALRRQLAELRERAGDATPNEPPPHY